jgi:peptidylprolyl isomerase
MRMRRVLVTALFGLGVVGCGEPPQLVEATAPGAIVDRPTEQSDENKPQAIGEQLVPRDVEPSSTTARNDIKPAPATTKGEVKTTEGGVKYETIQPGTGETVRPGVTVIVNYVGTLDDGKQFDSGKKREFPVAGKMPMIRGWDEGVVGMKVGEKRKLTIPPELGYGAQSKPNIPPNSTLHFEVEVVGIK